MKDILEILLPISPILVILIVFLGQELIDEISFRRYEKKRDKFKSEVINFCKENSVEKIYEKEMLYRVRYMDELEDINLLKLYNDSFKNVFNLYIEIYDNLLWKNKLWSYMKSKDFLDKIKKQAISTKKNILKNTFADLCKIVNDKKVFEESKKGRFQKISNENKSIVFKYNKKISEEDIREDILEIIHLYEKFFKLAEKIVGNSNAEEDFTRKIDSYIELM